MRHQYLLVIGTVQFSHNLFYMFIGWLNTGESVYFKSEISSFFNPHKFSASSTLFEVLYFFYFSKWDNKFGTKNPSQKEKLFIKVEAFFFSTFPASVEIQP